MKKLGFGCMRLPLLNPNDQTSIDVEQFCRMADLFLDRGFTYFDTAYMYHDFESERAVKKAVTSRYPRNSFTLADKLPVSFLHTQDDQERIFQEQLEKCGVDYFDFYLLHNLNAAYYDTASRLDSFGFVSRKKAEGLVRKFGFSFHDNAQLLDRILTEHPEVDFVQLQLNYLDWDNAGIQSGRCHEAAVRHGKQIVVMEPVKGGTLASVPAEAERLFRSHRPEMSIPSWAVRFAASQENVMTVLSGMSDLSQLIDNTDYMQAFQPLDPEEQVVISRAAQILLDGAGIPCTACRYCVDGCPKHIPIPDYFALYNAEKQAKNAGFSTQQGYYDNYAQALGKASDCIACRKCEKICPQHIPVSERMKDVAKAFETV